MFSRKNSWVDQSVSCPQTHSPEPVFVQAARSGNKLHKFQAAELTLRRQMIRKARTRRCKRNISAGCTPKITCQFSETYSF